MAKKTGRAPRSHPRLSREYVLRAAIALADGSGIESVSMRRLGQALGVEAMSLYRHLASREDLLDGMVDIVVSEIEVPSRGIGWKASMRRRAISAHEVVLRHPWASTLIESRKNVSPERLRYADTNLGSLREAGFPIESAYRAFLTLDSYIYGFTLQEVNWAVRSEELPEVVEGLRPQIPARLYPNVTEVLSSITRTRARRPRSKGTSASSYGSEFEFGLDLILDGLERLLDRR